MSKKMNVGLLRQWLNEDRIDDPDKMVTNEMLERWLFSHHIVDESEEHKQNVAEGMAERIIKLQEVKPVHESEKPLGTPSLVDESECEFKTSFGHIEHRDGNITPYMDIHTKDSKPKKIEKLEPRDMINSVNVSDKINEIIEAKDKESRKIDEEIDSIWDSIKDIWEAIKEKHSTIEKLETSKFDSTYDNILIDKINELIEARNKDL